MNQLAEEIKRELQELAEPEYRDFHAHLLPGVENIMGVRVPAMRKLAKKAARQDWRAYLADPSDDTYEEIMVQGMVIGYAKMETAERVSHLNEFVPKIDNWAVCDCCVSTCKFMAKDQELWFEYLLGQIETGTEFRIRFGAVALMDYFVSEEWIDRVLAVYDKIRHEGYYVKMAVAWGISVCYVKFPEKVRAMLKDNHLDDFTQNKAIQKIRESYRVSREDKEEIRRFRR